MERRIVFRLQRRARDRPVIHRDAGRHARRGWPRHVGRQRSGPVRPVQPLVAGLLERRRLSAELPRRGPRQRRPVRRRRGHRPRRRPPRHPLRGPRREPEQGHHQRRVHVQLRLRERRRRQPLRRRQRRRARLPVHRRATERRHQRLGAVHQRRDVHLRLRRRRQPRHDGGGRLRPDLDLRVAAVGLEGLQPGAWAGVHLHPESADYKVAAFTRDNVPYIAYLNQADAGQDNSAQYYGFDLAENYAIPEPGTLALLLLGAAMGSWKVVGRRRRRGSP